MKKIVSNPIGICPRCNEPWNIHDCPSVKGEMVEELRTIPLSKLERLEKECTTDFGTVDYESFAEKVFKLMKERGAE